MTTILTPAEDLFGGLTGGQTTNAITTTGAITVDVSPTPKNQVGYITVVNPSDTSKCEIMKFTANVGGTLTVTAGNRALGDTTVQTHQENVPVLICYNTLVHEEIDEALAARMTEDGVATLTNKTINGDNNTILNLLIANFKAGEVDTTITAPGSDSKIASTKAIVDYLVSISAGVLSVQANGGTMRSGNLNFKDGDGVDVVDNGDLSFSFNINESELYEMISTI